MENQTKNARQNKRASRGKKDNKKTKRIVWLVIAGVVVVGAAILGIYAYLILNKPAEFFDSPAEPVTQAPEETVRPAIIPINEEIPDGIELPEVTPTPEPTPVPELSPEIVNIALIGIDAYEDGSSSSGSMPHADTCMVIAVNYDENTVDIITIPRDCLTTVPGYRGYYKFNGSFNVGGGMDDPAAGFEAVCRTAEMWLGGVPVPYYYAVDFQAVIDIVDAIGGVDYDVDINYSYKHGSATKYVSKGQRHLDGEAVLGYLRQRTSQDGLDRSRTNRQRNMMIAIFKQLQSNGSITMIPSLISAANSGVYTNTNLAQTAALANYARNIDSDHITSRALHGKIILDYEWSLCMIEQDHRIEVLKEVYDIDVEPMKMDTPVYEAWLYDRGFNAIKYLAQAEKLLDYFNETDPTGAGLTSEQRGMYADFYTDYVVAHRSYQALENWYQDHYAGIESSERAEERELIKKMEDALKNMRSTCTALQQSAAETVDISWSKSSSYWRDPDINEVFVDFR